MGANSDALGNWWCDECGMALGNGTVPGPHMCQAKKTCCDICGAPTSNTNKMCDKCQISLLESNLKNLQKLFALYARHAITCASRACNAKDPCDCGLDDILKEINVSNCKWSFMCGGKMKNCPLFAAEVTPSCLHSPQGRKG